MMTTKTATELLTEHFRAFSSGDLDAVESLWHPQAVLEFPFSTAPIDPELVPPKLAGKEAILAFWQGAAAGLKPGGNMQFDLIQPLQDSHWCVAKGKGFFQTTDDRNYHNDYCFLVREQQGQLIEYFEYSNLLISMALFDIAQK